ncbi:hypothetical protein [Massilia varians]|uniref:hypothetical protein n=1 Tax=Massilia varians TaxID=457921 RepID=UPI0024917745|nr:hypothetical protein [Massilia varians]
MCRLRQRVRLPWRLRFIIRTRHRDMLRTIKPASVANQLPKLNNDGMQECSA